MGVVIHVAGMAAAVYVGLTVYLFVMQSHYVYFPDHTIAATPSDRGMPYEELTLTCEDGRRIEAWDVAPPRTPAAGGIPTGYVLLFCHGNAGDIGDRVDSVRTFHDLGFRVLLFEYGGYGRSEGRPTESGTYADAWAAWQYLTQTAGVPPERIVVFGRSLGGAVACWLAHRATPAALVLESTFTSAPDMAAGMYPYLPARLVCRFRYDSLKRIPEVACPVMIAHSVEDEMISVRHGRRLFEAAREPKCFIEMRGSHNAGGIDVTVEYQRALVKWVTDTAS